MNKIEGFGRESQEKYESHQCNTQDKTKDPISEMYIGQFAHYTSGPTGLTGVLKEYDSKRGYFWIKPTVVYRGDTIAIEDEKPSLITLERGIPITVRPLRGTIEEYVAEIREQEQKSEKRNNDRE